MLSRRFSLTRKGTHTAAFLAGGAVLALAVFWVWRDYKAWLLLGTGGLPSNLCGWIRTTRWRLQKLDPLDVSALRRLQSGRGDGNHLSQLPPRSTPRPLVGPHPVPHRQLTQRAGSGVIHELQAVFDQAVEDHRDTVVYAVSHFERHTEAITSRLPKSLDPIGGSSEGEIAHIHSLDGSMHMILSPSDALRVIESGWAELHGLAGKKLGLPSTYLLVYAPRSFFEVAIAGQLVRAAIAYMTGAGAGVEGS